MAESAFKTPLSLYLLPDAALLMPVVIFRLDFRPWRTDGRLQESTSFIAVTPSQESASSWTSCRPFSSALEPCSGCER